MDLPSRLAERLASGDLDVALIPSVEYLRGAASGYEILPGLRDRGPGAGPERQAVQPGPVRAGSTGWRWTRGRGPARPWPGSGSTPGTASGPRRIETLPMGVSALESTADAVLVIGDRAMKVPDAPFHAVVDLAEAWNELTGLPFVFALWVVRPGVDLGDLPEVLARCRAEGLAHADELAASYGPSLGIDLDVCLDYLTRVLSYDLGEPEVAGLRRFARMAADLGLAPEGADLVFHRRRDLATSR